MSKKKEAFKVGLIGFGNIGTGMVKYLQENLTVINARIPRPIELVRIADIDLERPRAVKVDANLLTARAEEIINDPAIDCVIELVGGVEPARSFIRDSLGQGKHVVTANKAVLSESGAELFELARRKGVALLCEASVGAGITIIDALNDALAANQFTAIWGIMNGTSNYILSTMEAEKREFREVLEEAQKLGYAEPDPTFDIEGYDTAHKISILASLAFEQDFRFSDVSVEGITGVESVDHVYADELGYRIKLLGIAKCDAEGRVEIRVHPTLVRKSDLLAQVAGAFNAIMVEGVPMGRQIFYGQGAGQESTASALLGDLMRLAAYEADKCPVPLRFHIPEGKKRLKPIEEVETPYYFRFSVMDRPGTMARLSAILANYEISIAAMIQKTVKPGEFATLIIVTHCAQEAPVRKALAEIEQLDICEKAPLVLRVED